jgi:molecular chaperone DnaK (HSP70)
VCAARRPSAGLDFGTSTTLVATTRGVIPIGRGGESGPWMPSLVGLAADGTVVTGEKAEDLADGATLRSIKRAITDNRDTVRLDLATGSREVRVDDLIVELLREVGRRGSRLGRDLGGGTTIRLGCPAMWDGPQRRRLLTAAQRADLPVLLATMVDEPVAAGIAWMARHRIEPDRPMRIVIFDMGGGTLDVAVLEVLRRSISVLAALGRAEAGDALDEAIATDLFDAVARLGIDLSTLPHPLRAIQRLRDAARTVKVLLTATDEEPISLDPNTFGRPAELWYSRARLNEVFAEQMDRSEEVVELALRVARLAGSFGSVGSVGTGAADEPDPVSQHAALLTIDELVQGIDLVLLSGGMSQVPYVRERLTRLFGSQVPVEFALDQPGNAVVIGLARAADYEKINVFRPSFDLLLEWDQGREFRTVYEAYTPIVGVSAIAGPGDNLRYVRRGSELALPQTGRGRFRVVSHSGDRIHATLGDRDLDGYPVAFTARFEFSIYPDGRIRLRDEAGIVDGLVKDWLRLDE